MDNRFNKCKSLEDLYAVFASEEGVQDFENLSVEELDRIALVFEANLPKGVVLPTIPLNKAGYTYIWNVVIEEIETMPVETEDENMEEDIMMNETTKTNGTINNTSTNMEDESMKNIEINEEVAATTEEEVAMGEKAKAFAEASKEKLANGFKFVTENVDVAADEVKKMANMNDVQLEEYLKDNGKDILDKIIDAVKKYSGKMKENADLFPSFKDRAVKADNIVELIKAVLDEEELTGWGKFKAIVKELVRWLLRLLVKVGAIVLKIVFTLAVGTIKIGATALVTVGKTVGVVNKEIIKPTVKAGKTAWNNHKAKKAEKAKEAEGEFVDDDDYVDEIREAIFGDDVE